MWMLCNGCECYTIDVNVTQWMWILHNECECYTMNVISQDTDPITLMLSETSTYISAIYYTWHQLKPDI